MRKALSLILFAAALLTANSASAQNPNYNPGPVWRVTYYSIKPGQGDAFWKDIRENFKPIYDELKKAGWITDYRFYTNPVADVPWGSQINGRRREVMLLITGTHSVAF